MATRREAREWALGLCYELEIRNADAESVLADLPAEPDPFGEHLVRGVSEHQETIDSLIRKYSEHWLLERMPLVDLAILRIGTFELGWDQEVSAGIVISEAVELAKAYSTENSSRFVNGLLARIAEDVRVRDRAL